MSTAITLPLRRPSIWHGFLRAGLPIVWALIGHRSRPIGRRAPLLEDSRSMAREPLTARELLERTALRHGTGLTPRELEPWLEAEGFAEVCDGRVILIPEAAVAGRAAPVWASGLRVVPDLAYLLGTSAGLGDLGRPGERLLA